MVAAPTRRLSFSLSLFLGVNWHFDSGGVWESSTIVATVLDLVRMVSVDAVQSRV